jgi:prevent-host-death family protein
VKQQVSLREANQHLSRYIEAVERGDEVIITRRGRPVAKLVPIAEKRRLTAEQQAAWERTLARMEQGFSLSGEKFERDSCYER